jgi:hypothetical protein
MARFRGLLTVIPLRQELPQSPESPESKSRRLLFDRVRQNLSDLMMTADEKNHVISNANEELDRQVIRLDTVFPYIAGEISEEARLGSLTHWAYSNKSAAKAATNERPRREAVAQRQDLTHVLQEAEAASRSEARRDAVLARKQRRAQVDADYEDTRSSGARKTNNGKSRGGDHADPSAAPKRRKVERPVPVETSVPMDRSASGAGSQRAANKDTAEKKRSRAPNTTTAARKRYVLSCCTQRWQLANFSPGSTLPTLHHLFWPLHPWSEHSMPHGVPPVQDPAQQGHNLHELSRTPERQATRAHGRRHRLPIAPTTVCRFKHLPWIHPLTTLPPQTKPPIPDPYPEMDPSRTNFTGTSTVTMKSMATSEHPLQQAPSAMTWKRNPGLPRPRRPRDAIPRHRPPCSLHSQNPVHAHGPREVKTRRLASARRRNPSHSLQYPPTTSRSMKATMKTRRASRGTATVMKSVSVRWLRAIMMLVRVNGSTCRVWA